MKTQRTQIRTVLLVILAALLVFSVPFVKNVDRQPFANAKTVTTTADFVADASAALQLVTSCSESKAYWSGNATNGYILQISGINMTTEAYVAIKLPAKTTVIFREGYVNTITSTHNAKYNDATYPFDAMNDGTIRFDGEGTIEIDKNASATITAPVAEHKEEVIDMVALRSLGNLTIKGEGALTVNGGFASGSSAARSRAIKVKGMLTLQGNITVTATSIDNGGADAWCNESAGIFADYLVVKDFVHLYSTSGKTRTVDGGGNKTCGKSYGIIVNNGAEFIGNCYVETKAQDGEESYGVYGFGIKDRSDEVAGQTHGIYVADGAVVKAFGGATNENGESCGLYIFSNMSTSGELTFHSFEIAGGSIYASGQTKAFYVYNTVVDTAVIAEGSTFLGSAASNEEANLAEVFHQRKVFSGNYYEEFFTTDSANATSFAKTVEISTPPLATVTFDEDGDGENAAVTTNFYSLDYAWDFALSRATSESYPATVTLCKDVEYQKTVTIGYDYGGSGLFRYVVLDLNGFTYDRKADVNSAGRIFDVVGSSLTIKDSSQEGSGVLTGGYYKLPTAAQDTTKGGGAILLQAYNASTPSKLTLLSGTIKGNYSEYCGGAIQLNTFYDGSYHEGGTFVMSGGALTENYSAYLGSAVYVGNTCKLTIRDVTIEKNGKFDSGVESLQKYPASAIGLSTGSVTEIKNAKIINNNGAIDIYAVGAYAGSLTLDDVEISGNVVKETSNVDRVAGIAGIYHTAQNYFSLILKNKVTIFDNTRVWNNVTTAANVYLGANETQSAYALLTLDTTFAATSKIGVAVNVAISGTEFASVTKQNASDFSGCFVSDNTKFVVFNDGNIVKLRAGYVVSFNLNGQGDAIASQTVISGKATKPADPAASGYVFGGWFTSSDCAAGKEADFTADVTASITFYAKWTKEKYTLTFDANGGSGSAEALTSVDYGAAITLPTLSKEGYYFVGWFNGDVAFSASAMPDMGANGANVTLKAKWAKETYTYKFDVNGGSSQSKTIVAQFGDAISMADVPAPTHATMYFAGWFENEQGTGSEFVLPQTMPDLGENNTVKTLYAKWVSALPVSFNVNGGVGEFAQQLVTPGEQASEPTTKPTRVGHKFDGWYLSADNGATLSSKYAFTSAVNEATTLYAKWTKETYVLAPQLNGGAGSVSDVTVTFGQQLSAVVFPTLQMEGHWINAWYINVGGVNTSILYSPLMDDEDNVVPDLGEDGARVDVKPTWALENYLFKFNANGGSACADLGVIYSQTVAFPASEKDGYVLVGWFTKDGSSSGDWGQYVSVTIGDMGDAGGVVMLYAKWKVDNSFTIKGKVVDADGNPVSGAMVILKAGATYFATLSTDTSGNFKIAGLTERLYQLVVVYDEKVVTKTIDLKSDLKDYVVTIPNLALNSIVEVAPSVPEIIVDNLADELTDADKLFAADANNSVEIKLSVDAVAESNVSDLITKAVGNMTIGMTFDVNVLKTKMSSGVEQSSEKIKTTNGLIKLIVPLSAELQGKVSYVVVREHEGKIQKITTKPNENGEYIEISADKTTLIMFVKNFSQYSLLYSNSNCVTHWIMLAVAAAYVVFQLIWTFALKRKLDEVALIVTGSAIAVEILLLIFARCWLCVPLFVASLALIALWLVIYWMFIAKGNAKGAKTMLAECFAVLGDAFGSMWKAIKKFFAKIGKGIAMLFANKEKKQRVADENERQAKALNAKSVDEWLKEERAFLDALKEQGKNPDAYLDKRLQKAVYENEKKALEILKEESRQERAKADVVLPPVEIVVATIEEKLDEKDEKAAEKLALSKEEQAEEQAKAFVLAKKEGGEISPELHFALSAEDVYEHVEAMQSNPAVSIKKDEEKSLDIFVRTDCVCLHGN